MVQGEQVHIQGRQSKQDNDLFFTCSLIEYIARVTKNHGKTVVNKLGTKRIEKIYRLADVYHCENIDEVSETFILESDIEEGNFDAVGRCKYNVPTHWDIGKVYQRLITMASKDRDKEIVESLFDIYNSFISEKIDDYNCAFYYDITEAQYESFLIGRVV